MNSEYEFLLAIDFRRHIKFVAGFISAWDTYFGFINTINSESDLILKEG